jgi:thiamine-monophosphate kinase
MNEFELIESLTRELPGNATVVAGAGDDCAVLDLGLPDRWVLFKTDAVVEGIHYEPGTPPEKIGRKALARCLSDVAAMGGEPSSALVTLALPRDYSPPLVAGVMAGLNRLAREHGVAVVGGETTTNPERMLTSVALLGTVEKNRCVRRVGAQPGDALFVTGELGGSGAGKHLDFEPRLAEARWLTEHFAIHAMLDLSDGLAGDLRHLLRASNAGAELLSDAIPISRAAYEQAKRGLTAIGAHEAGSVPAASAALARSGQTPLTAALTDGEDFELLFTVASKDAVPLLDAWKGRFAPLRLSCVGRITAKSGLTIRDRAGLQPLELHGYTHFA